MPEFTRGNGEVVDKEDEERRKEAVSRGRRGSNEAELVLVGMAGGKTRNL